MLPSFSPLYFAEDSIFVMESGYHQRILGCQSQKDFRDQDHPFFPLPPSLYLFTHLSIINDMHMVKDFA